jgi:hypothetical protein
VRGWRGCRDDIAGGREASSALDLSKRLAATTDSSRSTVSARCHHAFSSMLRNDSHGPGRNPAGD